MRRAFALALLACSACQTVQVEVRQLPTFDRAKALAPVGQPPRAFFIDSLDLQLLPELVPYVTVSGLGGSSRDSAAGALLRNLWDLAPDVILIWDSGTQQVGELGTYWGFGVSSTEPVYKRVTHGIGYRLSPVRLGIRWDDTGMVTKVEDFAAAAGIQEGDKLVSIGGATVDVGQDRLRSAHYGAKLRLKPGQPAKLIWIRPGTGRMEGNLACAENPPTHLSLPGALPPPRSSGYSYYDRQD